MSRRRALAYIAKNTFLFNNILNYRFTFMEMTQSEKEKTIRRNLDFLLLELPDYIHRLESLDTNFDTSVGWKEYKFCFKLCSGQIVSVRVSSLNDHFH